jgi:hypothetical protein
MPEHPKAEEIAGKMGIDIFEISTNATCQQCHFTVKKTGDELKSIAGISCESCHGAAADWIDIHNDKKMPFDERMKLAAEKGMNRPSDMYSLFRNCYECHTAPNEDIINKGGHPAGSSFELVAWSQGEIRHTFNSDETLNEEAAIGKKRVLFVLGKAIELETALDGFKVATDTKGVYFDVMRKRFAGSLKALKKIGQATGNDKINAIVAALGTNLNPADKDSLNTAILNVRKATQDFANNETGEGLAALDAIIPTAYKGTPVQ